MVSKPKQLEGINIFTLVADSLRRQILKFAHNDVVAESSRFYLCEMQFCLEAIGGSAYSGRTRDDHFKRLEGVDRLRSCKRLRVSEWEMISKSTCSYNGTSKNYIGTFFKYCNFSF